MLTQTKTTPAFAPVDTFAQSRVFTDRSNCRRAMAVFAGTHLLSPDEFEIKKLGAKDFRYQRTALAAPVAKPEPKPAANAEVARGLTSPAPKPVDGDIAAAIATFDASGIPACLRLTPAERKAAWDAQPPRQPAKIAARNTELENEMAKKISAAKPAKKKTVGKGRYDWAGAEEAALNGKVPSPPDFSAPTHKYYVPKLAEVVKMVKAADLKGLRGYKINGENTSPTAIKRYLACALVALTAKAKTAKA
jgi:hypothetical protein